MAEAVWRGRRGSAARSYCAMDDGRETDDQSRSIGSASHLEWRILLSASIQKYYHSRSPRRLGARVWSVVRRAWRVPFLRDIGFGGPGPADHSTSRRSNRRDAERGVGER